MHIDDTLEEIQSIDDPKIRIIQSNWNDNMQDRGYVYGQQKMIAQFNCTGDWAFYIEGDEIYHEDDLDKIYIAMKQHLENSDVEALVFNFYHFYGNANSYLDSPGWYRSETRIIKNSVRSYAPDGLFWLVLDHNKTGRYPKAKHTGVTCYHYGWVRSEDQMNLKSEKVQKYWGGNPKKIDYSKIDQLIIKEFNIPNLCLAGGVALNCVANGKILKEKIFDNIWIQPAAGDAGGSLGAALAFWHIEQNQERKISNTDDMQGSYLGPQYSQVEVEKKLNDLGAKFKILSEENLLNITAEDLSKGNAIGWFQGRMEFGPRALGARSIIADPRSSIMQKNLNLKVKYRESFRPFAPSVLNSEVSDWFNIDRESPYMLLVANIKQNKQIKMTEDQMKLFGIEKLNIIKSKIPAVTHVDYSARIQTVHEKTNSKYFKLIKKFKEKTGCPVVVNTSFNVRGEPIVNTPEDAFNCFMGTELDKLVIGNCYLDKKEQDQSLKKDYSNKFDLD